MNKTMENSEILRLRKELIHSRSHIADLQEELEEKHNLFINAIKERDQFKERLNSAKESVNRVENIVQSKVSMALEKERAEFSKLKEENMLFRQRLELLDQEKTQMADREKQLMDKIQGLTQDLAFYARNVDARESMKRLEILREEKDAKDRNINKLTAEINDLSNRVEDLMAENRTLRKMANVPKNYGINLEQVKLHDRDKIDDYKKLIRVLQEDNYRLEEERAKLKHMLKQQSMMYKQEPSQRYKGLTQEQIFKVDQYVMRLLAGETEEPADFYKLKKENQNLKAQLEALNSKGFEFVKNQIEFFFKEKGFGDSSKQLEKLMTDNDELRKMIRELLTKGMSGTMPTGSGKTHDFGANQSKFRPPVPHQGFDGDISQGYSYKFETHLDVVDKNGRPGIGETNRYDVACLQLQLQECLEIIKRKDENLITQQNEIETLYKRARDYLLVQDQLYKDFVKMEKDMATKKTDMEQQLRNTRDSLVEEQFKVKNLEQLIQTLQRGDKQTIESRLIELTKQNSINEVNLMRLTRKYQTLEEQEQMLRREYHNKEADMAEKDRFVQQRINHLKEWKARAIQQLKFLFQKLRLAIPISEYQSIQSSQELYQQKNADLIDRNAKMAQKMSKLQTQVRQNMEAEEKVRTIQELKEDTENELEVISKRLEQVDQNFRWENAIFKKVVTTLKRVRISPQQAFEEFDVNKDGKLTRDEFVRALDMLRVSDLSNQDIDVLMNSIDTDSDGYIKYREFVRKLSRHGVRSRTSEEQIIFLIIEALKRSRVKNLSEAFELIDKEGRGNISRDDFKDIFKNLNLKIDTNDIDKFTDHFWRDKTGGIDYQEFLRIFNRYQIKFDEEQDGSKKTTAVRVPEAILRQKRRIYMEISNAFKQTGKTLKSLFSRVDVDQSNEIEIEEFRAMFEKMGVKLTPQESESIFNSVDFDLSGKVTYPEFAADFDHFVSNDIDTLIREEKEKANASQQPQRESMKGTSNTNDDIMKGLSYGGPGSKNQEMQLQTRIAILEAREKQLQRKLETSMRIHNHAEASQHEIQAQYDSLDKKWNEITEHYHLQQERIRELESELRLSIRKSEAEKIKVYNESLQTELTETRAAMLSYKNMTEVIADQAKGLKLMIERKKDENENLVNAVRELQSQTVDQQRLGKLYYIVMLSRWQEAASNKKYDMVLTENKELRKELFNTEQMYQNKEYEHHECENLLQDKQLTIEKFKQSLANSKNLFLTLEKAEEMNIVIQDISDEKSELEEHYFKLRTEFLSTQLLMDEAQSQAEHATVLLETLQKSTQSELSEKYCQLSDKLKVVRLNELRTNREAGELKEKHNYLTRLLKSQIDQIKKLEEENSEFESRMHKREEEFRRADNDRMRRFFNARFDDIPGALAGGSPKRRTAFNDASEGFSPSRKKEQALTLNRDRTDYPAGSMFATGANQKQAAAENDVKFMEGKIKKLQDELRNATDEIKSREAIINRFKEWQLADKYLSQDETLKDAIDQHRVKNQAVHEQESKEMAEAAYQTIKSLQEMLVQKNEQLRNKEELITKLRQQMLVQREQDGVEIARLQQQLSLTAGTTLTKLQEIVVRHDAHQSIKGPNYGTRYERLTREELQKALDEKDNLIQELRSSIKGLEDEKGYINNKKNQLANEVQDLQQELRHERQQTELKANKKELERFKKELKEKDLKNENLRKAIEELNNRMMKYEIGKSDMTEDQKMMKVQEQSRVNELQKQVQDLQAKLRLMESSRNQRAEELKNLKVKEQEKKEADKKTLTERDDARKALQQTRDRLDIEIRHREKIQIELNAIKGEINIGRDLHSGPTYESLLARNKELENDNIILQCQQKTVVVYNKETATFEYIGEPIFLKHDKELEDLDELLAALRAWLARNERLTIKSIFEAQDKEKFGEISEAKFEQAFLKMGVKLRQKEKMILKEILDPRNIGFMRYKPLVRELSGIPQLDFMQREVIKLAKLVESRDLSRQMFTQLVDPSHQESMNLTQLQESFKSVKSENFQMTDAEVETLFKYVTKSIRTVGVTISINRFSEKVYLAVQALLIEKMKDAVNKTMRPLSEIFSKFDTNKDGKLAYSELENLLLECQLALKPNMLDIVYGLLDPGKKTSKISYDTLKFFISEGGQSVGLGLGRSLDYEPSLERVSLSQETSQEEFNMCRQAARKILSACQNNLPDLLAKYDKHGDGIVSREDVQRTIEEQKVRDLSGAELKILLKYLDKSNRGYISITNLTDKLQELAIETKEDTMLRRFGTTIKHQGINIAAELQKFDTSRNGRMDKKLFARAMKQLSIALTDEEIDQLFSTGELPDQKGYLDIKHFVNKVTQAQKSKPLPTFIAQAPKTLGAASKVQSKGQSSTFENWEAEKKYKKKLEALQQQIEESKKETQAVEKQAKHWQEMANKLEKEKNQLQARLVDLNAKPPKAAQYESLNQGQLEQMQSLKDQMFYLQEENNKLERTIQVELKSELSKLNREKDNIEDKYKQQSEESKRLQHQVNRLIGKPMDTIAQREEGELWRERKIQELERQLSEKEAIEQDLNDQLFKAEERLLDLKFQKETFDLQYARLQKRITDLEQYKLASSKFSSVLKKQEDNERQRIDENAAQNVGYGGPGQSKKQGESVKLKSKSTKSVAELEMVVESLKRVIEKLKSENDSLKKQIGQSEKHMDKLKSEKQLRQKIETLELELHSHNMKDLNLGEKDKNIKKLLEANRQLREDLKREEERYLILEKKYKDLLISYNMLSKENKNHAELLFNMNTGGNINNYDNYLSKNESSMVAKDSRGMNQSSAKKRNISEGGQKKTVDASYDRTFEDVF